MAKNLTLVLLIIMTVLSLAGLSFSPMLCFGSVFLFDTPGSEKNPAVKALFYTIVTFPFVCVAGIAISWVMYARNWHKTACIVTQLPLLNVALFFILIFGPARTGRGYEIIDGEWAYVSRTFGGVNVKKLDADNETFEVLTTGKGHFAKDKFRVYLWEYVIPGADPATFTTIKGPYTRDKTRFYCGTVAMQVANPDTFEVILGDHFECSIIYDKDLFQRRYGMSFVNLEISSESPVVVQGSWARDGEWYYYGPARVEGADYATFRFIDDYSARDANREYRGAVPREKDGAPK